MADKIYPSQMQDRFMLRLPDGMRDKIAERARLAGRSMNAEIVEILERGLELAPDEVEELVGTSTAVRHLALELNRGIMRALVAGGVIQPTSLSERMDEVVTRLRAHADQFERTGGPSPSLLRSSADSLQGDLEQLLKDAEAPHAKRSKK